MKSLVVSVAVVAALAATAQAQVRIDEYGPTEGGILWGITAGPDGNLGSRMTAQQPIVRQID